MNGLNVKRFIQIATLTYGLRHLYYVCTNPWATILFWFFFLLFFLYVYIHMYVLSTRGSLWQPLHYYIGAFRNIRIRVLNSTRGSIKHCIMYRAAHKSLYVEMFN